MKNVIGSLVIIVVILMVVSCKPCKEITTTVHDTVSHQVLITPHDTSIVSKPDSAGWRAFFICQKTAQGQYMPVINSQSASTGNHIHVNSITNNQGDGLNVNVICKEDSLKTVITLLNKTITDFRDKETVRDVPKNYLTGWQWTQVYAGRVLMGILLIIILFLGIKFALKYFKVIT